MSIESMLHCAIYGERMAGHSWGEFEIWPRNAPARSEKNSVMFWGGACGSGGAPPYTVQRTGQRSIQFYSIQFAGQYNATLINGWTKLVLFEPSGSAMGRFCLCPILCCKIPGPTCHRVGTTCSRCYIEQELTSVKKISGTPDREYNYKFLTGSFWLAAFPFWLAGFPFWLV